MNVIRHVQLTNGYAYSSGEDHHRTAERAQALIDHGFGRFVTNTKTPEPNEDGNYPSTNYYDTTPFMINERDFKKLQATGAPYSVMGMTNREVIPMEKTTFVIGTLTFIAWNVTLVLKVAGVL